MVKSIATRFVDRVSRRFLLNVVRRLDGIEGTAATTLARTWDMDAELHNHVDGLNRRLVHIESMVAELNQRTSRLEVDTREAVAHRWDEVATVRRLAALESWLADGTSEHLSAEAPES